MHGQVMLGRVEVYLLLGPESQRIDLEAAKAGVGPQDLDGAAGSALVACQAASHGVALRTRIAVYGMDSMCRMVQHALGIAILPAKAVSLAGRYPGLAVLALNEPWAERVLSVAVLADTELEPAAKALLEALTASAGREGVPLSQSFPTTTQETSS